MMPKVAIVINIIIIAKEPTIPTAHVCATWWRSFRDKYQFYGSSQLRYLILKNGYHTPSRVSLIM